MLRKIAVLSLLFVEACLASGAQHKTQSQASTPEPDAPGDRLAVDVLKFGASKIDAGSVSLPARVAFENGVRLNNGFAEGEARRAFQLAERLDPTCAMCYWGEAASLAPTINYTIDEKTAAQAVAVLAKASALSSGLSEKEKALIGVERARYVMRDNVWKVDDVAEWQAASKLAAKYPQDDALQVNAANAAMIAAENGRPGSATPDNPRLVDAERLLNAVLHRAPNYTPAIHFYLHLTEWQGRPEASKDYADRLASLAPESGHMLHMVSHIDYHIGEYEAAALENMRAAESEIAYVKQMQPPGGMQAIGMHQHNLIFGLVAALLSGDEALSLRFAEQLHVTAPKDSLWFSESYIALGRLLPAEQVIKLPPPDAPLPSAFYHFAMGEAYVRQSDSDAALREAAMIDMIQKTGSFGSIDPRVVAMLTVASHTLEGQAAMVRKDYRKAVDAYSKAAQFAEENEPYADPPVWPWSPRRSVAEAFFLKGNLEAARKEIEAALTARPGDPIALKVFAEIKRGLGDPSASRTEEEASKAWHGSPDQLRPGMI